MSETTIEEWVVELNVLGTLLVTVTAENEVEAMTKAMQRVGFGESVEIEVRNASVDACWQEGDE